MTGRDLTGKFSSECRHREVRACTQGYLGEDPGGRNKGKDPEWEHLSIVQRTARRPPKEKQVRESGGW